MKIIKPCDECLILMMCSSVCDPFLQWAIDANQKNLTSHPHFVTATIKTKQISWFNEKIKKRDGMISTSFLFDH
jgi:hypothetical protein